MHSSLWVDNPLQSDTATSLTRAGPLIFARKQAERAIHKSGMAAMKGIAPRDEIEGMLAAQMVGTHDAAEECLRRAMIPGQALPARDMNLRHAAKLMALYERQLAALDKHRGKGQQKITVEHVTVEAGGQAIVGDGHAGSERSGRPSGGQAVLSDDRAAEELSRGWLKQAVPAEKERVKAKK